jgi:aminoglycoside phosphotransferase (APT) family kinase protein
VLTAVMDEPRGDIQVDVELVEVLLAQQHPNLATLPLRASECGFDNFMFRLGESFAVRLPRSAAAARLLANEQRWLITLSDRLPLQIPVPIRVGQPAFGFPWRWSVVPWLTGSTAEIAPVAAREAPRLAGFLRALHVPAPADAPRNAERSTPLTSRAAAIAERTARLARITDVVSDRIREAWRESLEAPAATQSTWIHGDLHARNVLTLDGTITGVIDWGDMTSGDPAIDLACLWMLLPDEAAREAARLAYGSSDASLWIRARGWAVLFGVMLLDTGLVGNARNAAMGEQILRRI